MNRIEKSFLPECPPGTPVWLATSVGDMMFLRTGNGDFIPHPTEDNPIRIGFVGDRPTFTSVDWYAPHIPDVFGIDGNSPDSKPMEFDADGLSVAPEVAKGCFRRDGDDLLMVDTAILERIWSKRWLRIVAVGKSEDHDPVISGISVPMNDEQKIDGASVQRQASDKGRCYFVSAELLSADDRTRAFWSGLVSVLGGGLESIRSSLMSNEDWIEKVNIISLTPLSEDEYEFLKN